MQALALFRASILIIISIASSQLTRPFSHAPMILFHVNASAMDSRRSVVAARITGELTSFVSRR